MYPFNRFPSAFYWLISSRLAQFYNALICAISSSRVRQSFFFDLKFDVLNINKMRRISLIGMFLIFCLSLTFGQTATDSISMEKGFWGYEFHQNGEKLTNSQLKRTIKPNKLAYKKIKTARSSLELGAVIQFTGGYMIGWPIGTAISGEEANWALAGIGLGLALVSIPITQSAVKKAQAAIDLFNAGMVVPTTSSVFEKAEVGLRISGGGVGLSVKF